MIFDLLIIGGGINGCAIARDAAGRGLSVRLVEQGDLASGTSSASTKLIHGGLRYLELYEFRLVHEALVERELLLGAAALHPHDVHYAVDDGRLLAGAQPLGLRQEGRVHLRPQDLRRLKPCRRTRVQ